MGRGVDGEGSVSKCASARVRRGVAARVRVPGGFHMAIVSMRLYRCNGYLDAVSCREDRISLIAVMMCAVWKVIKVAMQNT